MVWSSKVHRRRIAVTETKAATPAAKRAWWPVLKGIGVVLFHVLTLGIPLGIYKLSKLRGSATKKPSPWWRWIKGLLFSIGAVGLTGGAVAACYFYKIPYWYLATPVAIYALWKAAHFGYKKLYQDYVSHLLGTYRNKIIGDKSREAIWMRFSGLPDSFYFHYLVWWCLGIGAYQSIRETTPSWAGVATLAVLGLVLHTRYLDLNLRRLTYYVIVAILLWLADNGLSLKYPEVLPRGVLRPVFRDFTEYLDIYMSSGAYYILAILTAIYVAWTCVLHVLDNRWELDERDLHFKKLTGEVSSGNYPRFARPIRRRVPDLLEWLSGCADLEVEIGANKIVIIKNVFGLAWWLKKPFTDLSYATTRKQREGNAAEVSQETRNASAREDIADFVEPNASKHENEAHGASSSVQVHEVHAHTEHVAESTPASEMILEPEKDHE
jgi:hypothetical protein